MFNGVLRKMITELKDPVNYFLDMGSDFIVFNSIIENNITIEFDGYSCLNCCSNQEIYGICCVFNISNFIHQYIINC